MTFNQNLPVTANMFFGRTEELAAIKGMMSDPTCRLLVITGPGGVGKTRLALRAAESLVNNFTHGIFFVALYGIDSESHLLSALSEALDLPFFGHHDRKQQIVDAIREKEVLILLDNFDDLIHSASLLTGLLHDIAGLKLLVTCRTRLHLPDEWRVEISGLSLPADGEAGDPEKHSAVALFVHRARQIDARFTLNDQNRIALTQICQQVDGLPLGIELAAAWLRLMSSGEISERLHTRLTAVNSDDSAVPERHRSLWTVCDSSWRMLGKQEQDHFQRLSVFPGTFDLDAAQAVTDVSLATLWLLVDWSMLRRDATGRCSLHAVMGQFAAAKLAENPKSKHYSRTKHARYYLDLLNEWGDQLRSPEQLRALAALRTEHINLVNAWRWAVANGWVDLLERVADPFHLYLDLVSRFAEGIELFGTAADDVAGVVETEFGSGDRLIAILRARQGQLCYRIGNVAEAGKFLEASLATIRGSGSLEETAFCLDALGAIALRTPDLKQAQQALVGALEIYQQTSDLWGTATVLNNLGTLAARTAAFDDAEHYFKQALELRIRIGDRRGQSDTLVNQGLTALMTRRHQESRQLLDRSLALRREIGDRFGEARILGNLGSVAVAMNEWGEARRLYLECLAVVSDVGSREHIAVCQLGLGATSVATGEYAEAASHLSGAYRLAQEIGNTILQLQTLDAIAQLMESTGREATALLFMHWFIGHPSAPPHVKPRVAQRVQSLEERLTGDIVQVVQHQAGALTAESLTDLVLQSLLASSAKS